MDMKKNQHGVTQCLFLLLFVCFVLLAPFLADAASVMITWEANIPSPEGYKVFVRQIDQVYDYSQPDWTGDANSCVIDNLKSQIEYSFVVRAFDGLLDSVDSDEVSCMTGTVAGSETESAQAEDTIAANVYAAAASGDGVIQYSDEANATDAENVLTEASEAFAVTAVTPPLLLLAIVLLLAMGAFGRHHLAESVQPEA